MSDFKKITLIDPLGEFPNLELIPGDGGYSRGIVNPRKPTGRTLAGATKIGGHFSPSYYLWHINLNILSQEKVNLFSDIFESLTEIRLARPTQYPNPAYLLADQFRPVPASVGGRYTLIAGSESIRPGYAGNSANLITGYGLFKVAFSVDEEYLKEQTSCRSKLTFTAEEVY